MGSVRVVGWVVGSWSRGSGVPGWTADPEVRVVLLLCYRRFFRFPSFFMKRFCKKRIKQLMRGDRIWS